MFTGIIEEVGTLAALRRFSNSAEIEIAAHKVLENTKVGDSISVNGVCLTVTALKSGSFVADAMPETLRRSVLGSLPLGAELNLERALLPTTRLGGHMVSGHIDGLGTIQSIRTEGIASVITITAHEGILRYVVEKGSVAIDGISLTVVATGAEAFSVSVIPHTLANTNLHAKRIGDDVDIECDMVGKYVEKLILAGSVCDAAHGRDADDEYGAPFDGACKTNQSEGLTFEFLAQHGF